MSKKAPAKQAPAKKDVPPTKPSDFLLDVHTEPLPARFLPPALEQLKTQVTAQMTGTIHYQSVKTSGTLRHLIVEVKGVEAFTRDAVEVFKGPPAEKLKNPDGTFTVQAEGFAKKYGLSPEQLGESDGKLCAAVRTKGVGAQEYFSALIPRLLKSLQFPKFMTWEESGFKFGRPIRAITALVGEKIVAVELAGVKSGRAVYGHPVLGKPATPLKDPAKHAETLRQGLIISDPAERKAYLLAALELAAKSAGGKAEADVDLIDETVFMVEHPVPVLGRLRGEHGALPAALLKTVMKKQLKFFPVIDSDGALLAFFVGVRDGLSTGNDLVREGYERVLAARLSDAAFFLGRDGASTLESKLPLLERVTYQKALGSMSSRAARVEELARWICARLRSTAPVDEQVAVRAAKLAYADLVTDVVKEFPELQGLMGGVYARKDGEGERVALAVEQFYYPVAAKTSVPATAEAAVVSLAGKLDALAGCFAVGMIPTGSADPYALRRQALGLVRIVLEKQLPLDLDEAVAHAVSFQPVAAARGAELAGQLSDFIWGRACALFSDMGYAVDEVRSVRAGALKDVPNAFRRLAALRAVRRDPSFASLAAAFKRASNILKQSPGPGAGPPGEGALDRALLQDPAERDLYDALVAAEGAANDRIVRGDFEGGLKSLVSVKPHLDLFFDKVMVMAEDAVLKRQRLALLRKLVRAFCRVADLSEIQASAS